MKKANIRIILLVVTSILCCYFSVGYSKDMYDSMISEHLIEFAEDVNIDGADFTPFVNLAVVGANGLLLLLTVAVTSVVTTVFTLIFVLLLRVTMIRKSAIVTSSEPAVTRRIILISSALAVVTSILITNIGLTGYILLLSWQQPLFMLLLYYLPLRKRMQNEQKADE